MSAFVFLIFSFFSENNASASISEEIIPASLTINKDVIWSGRKILNGSQVKIESGATLTLSPGTTLVGNNGAMIYVLGRLIALGEEERKIRFTANPLIKQASSLNFFIESGTKSEINLKNFILERGGGNQGSSTLPALTVRGKATLEKGIIKRNKITAIRNWGTDLVIKNSELYENENLTLENKNTIEVNAEDNWWGEDGGPNQGGNSVAGKTIGTIDSKPWENKGPIPVIFLPGIGGSLSFQLFNKNFHDYWFLTPFGTGAYRDFVKNLILNGYQHEENFFWGFYDWRMSNKESAKEYLKKLIDQIRAKNEHFEVDLVAHSMGGIMARSYIQSDFFGDDVDRLVALGTPHLGSSDVYSIWEGEEFPEESQAIELYLWFRQALNPEEKYSSIIRKDFSSIGEMLPIYDHLTDIKNEKRISYKDQKQKNIFLEELKADQVLTVERTTVDLMAGTGQPTLESIPVDLEEATEFNWRDGKPNPFPPVKDVLKGDDRVTEKSALAGGELGGASIITSSHADLPEKAAELVFNQMKIKPKNPWVKTSIEYFIFGLSGLVEIVIEDEFGRLLSLSKKEIPGGFIESSGLVDNKKLAYADFPIDGEKKNQKIKMRLSGQKEGEVHFAFWTLTEKNKVKREFQKYLGSGIDLELEVVLARKDNGNVEPEIISEKYDKTISFIYPKSGEKILNWKKIQPEISLWQSTGFLKEEKKQMWLDDILLEEANFDLAKLKVGKHQLKVKRFFNQDYFEESSLEFESVSSIKSLITVIGRDFKNGGMKEVQNRNTWLNDLAISYQFLSNGKKNLALEQLNQLALKIQNDGLEDAAEKEKLKSAIMAIIENPI